MFDHKEDKRRHKRSKVEGLYGNMLSSADFNIVNISIDGAAIETTKRLNIDRKYALKIMHQEKVLNLRGVVVWSVLSHTETKATGEVVPVYKAGIKFTNVLNDKSSDLLKFIYQNKTDAGEKRLLVRFWIKKVDNAVLDYPCEYNIKRISLSGMLIETEDFFVADYKCDLEIFLNKRIILVAGRVVNCKELMREDAVKYEIGMEFLKMSSEDRNFLKQFLDSLDR